MTASLSVIVVVLVAGVIHAIWNAIAKSFHDQWVSFTLLNVGVTVPCIVALPIVGFPRSAAWPYLAAAVACHIVYELFLMSAYTHGSLSRSYPIARGIAPMLTTVGGYVIAGEHVGARALVGIALVIAAIASLALVDRTGLSRRAVSWALLTGVMIAVYTIVDGYGVRASHRPSQYAMTLFAIQGTLFVLGALVKMDRGWLPARRLVALGALGGVLSIVGYATVLWAQTRAPLGVVSALRETGVLWAAVLGVLFFKERGGWRVLLSGAGVAAGIALIALR